MSFHPSGTSTLAAGELLLFLHGMFSRIPKLFHNKTHRCRSLLIQITHPMSLHLSGSLKISCENILLGSSWDVQQDPKLFRDKKYSCRYLLIQTSRSLTQCPSIYPGLSKLAAGMFSLVLHGMFSRIPNFFHDKTYRCRYLLIQITHPMSLHPSGTLKISGGHVLFDFSWKFQQDPKPFSR
jgi:hypothetical protein